MKVYDIRSLTDAWAQNTFSEDLRSAGGADKTVLSYLMDGVEALGIKNKFINGYACEGLPKTEEGRIGHKINYTDVFHELFLKNDLSPTKYLIRLTELYFSKNALPQRYVGFLSRGLRSLTSFLREPDFAYNLLNLLKLTDPHANASLGSSQDAGDHTDVLITYREITYRLWLFQYSDRGLPHDIDRITGRRGELPAGLHLLCPLVTEKAIAYDSYLQRKHSLLMKMERIKLQLVDCSEKAIAKKLKLLQREKSYNEDLNELNELIAAAALSCSSELDVVNGWYFYSKQHIKRISSIIQNPVRVLSYDQTVEILEAPRKFLAEPKMFIR